MFRIFGNVDNDPGQPVSRGVNPLTQEEVVFFLRKMPSDIARAMEARYGREEHVKNENGFLVPQFKRTQEQYNQLLNDKAEWMWRNATGFTATPEDEAGAAMLRELLVDDTIQAGSAVKFDGRFTSKVKRFFLVRDMDLALWVLQESEKLQDAAAKKERLLTGNS